VLSALLLVVFRQALTQTMYLNADVGIFALLEVLTLAKDVDRDRVFRDGLGVLQRFATDVA
jgi:hypothetical protein